ncbi:MAG: hypothetical protein ACI81P_003181 [Neolewinella sp.]|jgi:hypothetical protein
MQFRRVGKHLSVDGFYLVAAGGEGLRFSEGEELNVEGVEIGEVIYVTGVVGEDLGLGGFWGRHL